MRVRDAGVARAVERTKLACKALSAAARDLAVAQHRHEVPVDAAQELNVEVERVCELAEQLERCAESLDVWIGRQRVPLGR